MPAITYKSRGEHLPVVSASAALTGGTLAVQEGVFGIVITGCAIGKSTILDALGIHQIAVPASTVKGDRLYATPAIAAGGDVYPVTLTRTKATGLTCIGIAVTDRASDGTAQVKLAHQPVTIEA